ncbi:MAG: alpha/beta hydrolase [Actinobacteria bacterium]|nr:alpha/beta hydrolase [Actinomycetota bacterium]MBI3686790.1 alpha/beta hydrolase [Actinomycetota bacterium]
MKVTRRAGVLGSVAGVGAATVAAGLAVERYAVGRYRRTPDPEAGQPFGALVADRSRSVTAEDGAALYVEEVGPLDAPLTVVFVHGYCLSMGSWHYQRIGLTRNGQQANRMVFYDQRGHGRSGRGDSARCTIDQLGRDLFAVLGGLGPGPLVLVGHSMGGMTIMALAEQHPELFGDRVVGTVLLSTSTGLLGEVTLGLPALLATVKNPLLPALMRQLGQRARMAERGRRLGADLMWLAVRRVGFGGRQVPSSLVDYAAEMIAATPIPVIADLYTAVVGHEKLAALAALHAVPTLVVVGGRDVITPPEHSRRMVAALPGAELLEIEEAGHVVMMERPDLVNLHLRSLLTRVSRGDSRRPSRRA